MVFLHVNRIVKRATSRYQKKAKKSKNWEVQVMKVSIKKCSI